MSRRISGGNSLLEAFRAALANLEAHEDEVNALNVVPVPDGDTGSNMLATLRAAVAEADQLPGDARSVGAVTGAIGHGALMGARGNSGVILSQILRGLADALSGRRQMNALDLANGLAEGSRTAHEAVVRPVEGTILTVVREASMAAVAVAESEPDLEAVLAAAVEAAAEAVARTPSQLPILREAGVVDAGGEGLYRVLQGALRGLLEQLPTPEADDDVAFRAAVVVSAEPGRPLGYGYETVFLVTPEQGSLDLDAIRARLEAMGSSVLVAGDGRAAKVHVHNDHPDLVLAYGLSLGQLSHINVENLDLQARAARGRDGTASDAAALPVAARAGLAAGIHSPQAIALAVGDDDDTTGAAFRVAVPGNGAGPKQPVPPDGREPAAPAPAHAGPAIVAVAAGEGLVKVFESFGVAEVVSGGQSANPSAGELLRAAQRQDRLDVLILPNNPNVKLAAQQAAALSRDHRIVVVPTRNAAEGFAALLAYEPSRSALDNAAAMSRAASSIQTLQVTAAVRDAKIGDRKVRKGQAIALDPDDGLVAADSDVVAAVTAAVGSLRPGFELLTIYYGGGADLAEAEALSRALGLANPGVEVEVLHGGQPHYRYLLAAE